MSQADDIIKRSQDYVAGFLKREEAKKQGQIVIYCEEDVDESAGDQHSG